MVKFSDGNSKLNVLARFLGFCLAWVVTFDIPAGYTCTKAKICKGFANRKTGKVTRIGRLFCYAVHQEAYLKAVRAFRWSNYMALLECANDINQMVNVIIAAMGKKFRVVRIHSAGDFFSYNYFMAWVRVAEIFPNVSFFGYTKHLEYVLFDKPDNFNLVYSYGSEDDDFYNQNFTWETIPTCFVEEYQGQFDYTGLPYVCVKEDEGYQDYQKIMDGKSFIIKKHVRAKK
jgi:hypothetical protein